MAVSENTLNVFAKEFTFISRTTIISPRDWFYYFLEARYSEYLVKTDALHLWRSSFVTNNLIIQNKFFLQAFWDGRFIPYFLQSCVENTRDGVYF